MRTVFYEVNIMIKNGADDKQQNIYENLSEIDDGMTNNRD